MAEESFDIEHFLNFDPPRYICLKCKALLSGLEEIKNAGDTWNKNYRCPVCKMIYRPSQFYAHHIPFFSDNEHQITFGDNIVEHCKRLASIAVSAKEYLIDIKKEEDYVLPRYPPMRAFLESIQEAKNFVHFVSFGISPSILGALKTVAVKVPVRGIISGLNTKQKQNTSEFSYESPGLQIKTFLKGNRTAPHQKFVIIDGLLALAGSVNLTDTGLRNAEKGRDIIEFITDVRKIVSLNNTHFSPIWSEFCEINEIEMERYSCIHFDPVY
ncbi:MAG: phospholipase D-like domain-containing protein [Planctomycetota bacterium]